MAILSGKRARNGPSSGHDFDRIKEGMFGHGKSLLNKKKDLFGSDYIYMYREDKEDDDVIHDGEVGVNKNYHRIHDMDWCNCEKNEHHALNRFFDGLPSDDDIEYGDVEIDDVDDFFFGEGDDNEQ